MSPCTLCSLATPAGDDIGDHDGHAGGGERAGGRVADADRLAAAGDQRNAGFAGHANPPLKLAHHLISACSLFWPACPCAQGRKVVADGASWHTPMGRPQMTDSEAVTYQRPANLTYAVDEAVAIVQAALLGLQYAALDLSSRARRDHCPPLPSATIDEKVALMGVSCIALAIGTTLQGLRHGPVGFRVYGATGDFGNIHGSLGRGGANRRHAIGLWHDRSLPV